MPTLLIWGEREPLGSVSVAQAVTELIPRARLQVLPTGHGPWLGQPAQTAATVVDFVGDQVTAKLDQIQSSRIFERYGP
jgi:pimeloyl-ACP methyl ester carboxylesterase